MVPELVACDRCGRTVIVLGWSPIYDDAVELASVDDSHSLDISCRVECPSCGPRFQQVKPLHIGDDLLGAAWTRLASTRLILISRSRCSGLTRALYLFAP